jgi:hypothetical protein
MNLKDILIEINDLIKETIKLWKSKRNRHKH